MTPIQQPLQRAGLIAGGVAMIAMATLASGCSPTTEKPSNEPATRSEAPAPSGAPGRAPSPTEKAAPTLTPGGPNSFSPTILAPHAPTALPGNVVTG